MSDETRILAEYGPPFDLLSDLLFAFALAPVAPLRAAFPGVPFLSLAGRTPLALWFGRVKAGRYRDPRTGGWCWLGGPTTCLYYELNVVALLRRPAGFVPGIYATSPLTVAVGHAYGMPKQMTQMELQVRAGRIRAAVVDGARPSFVRARLLTAGWRLGGLLSSVWPRRSLPAYFPDGRRIGVLIQTTPRVQLAHVQSGRLHVAAAWCPRPIPLLPFGVYLPDQQMRLPPPPQTRQAPWAPARV